MTTRDVDASLGEPAGAEAVHVEDLSSTNGTFVNDQRVHGSRQLKPGDRISVGDHVITFCVMEPSAGSITVGGDADGTLVFSGNPLAAEALQGDLTQIPTFALLQMLELGKKTGVLDIGAARQRARLWLGEGRPVHAEVGEMTGLDAALHIARLEAGRFTFEPGGTSPQTSITHSVAELLLESSRRHDEATR